MPAPGLSPAQKRLALGSARVEGADVLASRALASTRSPRGTKPMTSETLRRILVAGAAVGALSVAACGPSPAQNASDAANQANAEAASAMAAANSAASAATAEANSAVAAANGAAAANANAAAGNANAAAANANAASNAAGGAAPGNR